MALPCGACCTLPRGDAKILELRPQRPSAARPGAAPSFGGKMASLREGNHAKVRNYCVRRHGAGSDRGLRAPLRAVDGIPAPRKEPEGVSLKKAGRLDQDLDLRRRPALLRQPHLQPLYLRLAAAEVPLIGPARLWRLM